MAGTQDQPRLLCIWVKSTPSGQSAAIALIDNLSNELQLSEISDSTDMACTQSLLMAQCPSKVLCWSSLQLDSVEEQCREVGVDFELLEGSPGVRQTHLVDFLRPEFTYLAEKWDSSVPGAVRAALHGLSHICIPACHQFAIRDLQATPYMVMDLNAIKALDLFGKKPTSLYTLLNNTSCSLGATTLRKWLSQPLKSVPQIQERQLIVGELLRNRGTSQRLADKLRQVPDLNALFLRFARKLTGASHCANLQDCVKLYHFVRLLQSIESVLLESQIDSLKLITAGLQEAATAFHNLPELVERGIDLASYAKDLEYHVNPDFSEELRVLKQDVQAIEKQVEELAVSVARSLRLGSASVKVVVSPSQGYLFETSKADLDAALRTLSDDIGVKVASHKMQKTSFTVPTLISLSTQKQRKLGEISSVQAGLADKVVGLVATYAQITPKTAELLGELDVLLSLATFCSTSPKPYVKCDIDAAGDIVLCQNRHPGLERISADCKANDVYLSRNNGFLQIITGPNMGSKNNGFLQIITGPNMGGKTTYLRQVALAVVLNQIGCYVPCSPGPNRLPIIDSVLARVGACDQSTSGLSTYMMEMLDVASLLRAVTPASLVIIDELGRGTSTSDGIGFSEAVIEYLSVNVRCFTLIATHFTELTQITLPGVTFKRMAAEVQSGQLTFHYSVIDGAADSSYGIEVAALIGYSAEDVQAALAFRQEMDSLISPELQAAYQELSSDQSLDAQRLCGIAQLLR